MDEARLRERLHRIEAASTGTERDGAAESDALARARERLDALARVEPSVEMKLTMREAWAHNVLLALLRRYGVEPYRKRGQHETTVMVKAPKTFINETVLPAYDEVSAALNGYIEEVTFRLIANVIEAEVTAAGERDAP